MKRSLGFSEVTALGLAAYECPSPSDNVSPAETPLN
jgi:hypothetical protein